MILSWIALVIIIIIIIIALDIILTIWFVKYITYRATISSLDKH